MEVSGRIKLIKSLFEKHKLPNFRFQQTIQNIYDKKVQTYSEMTSLPKSLRDEIVTEMKGDSVLCMKPATVQDSTQATKVLFQLPDDQKIESVYMKFNGGHTSLCISSQVGCALKCNFCATGAVGFKRQLTADEISDQILYFQQQGKVVDSVSFMGMGEPFMNPKLFDALKILTHKDLFNMQQRRFSVSTVGIIPGIERLTKEFPHVNLAFSLHSPFDEQRSVLVPANKNYPLKDVLKVLDNHVIVSNRKVFIAYLVLEGFNDTPEHIKAIIGLFNNRPKSIRHLFHLNLLRYNPAFGIDDTYKKTEELNLKRFMSKFEEAGISVTARRSFGVDIDAACGQLYAKYSPKTPKVNPVKNEKIPGKFLPKTSVNPLEFSTVK